MAEVEDIVVDEDIEQEVEQVDDELSEDEPEVGGDVNEQNGGNGQEAPTHEQELIASRILGDFQPHVSVGLGATGESNAVVLLFTSTYISKSNRGQDPVSNVVVHASLPGTSLDHIAGFQGFVATANHALSGLMAWWGAGNRKLAIYAMLATKYDNLNKKAKKKLSALQQNGAIKAERFYASARDLQLKNYVGTPSLLVF
jgi:hypothetical protein